MVRGWPAQFLSDAMGIFATWEEWKNIRRLQLDADPESVECGSCSGFGETECSECGNYSTCDECEDGRVCWSEASVATKDRALSQDFYFQAVMNDARAYAAYTSKQICQALFDHGFSTASRIRSKELFIVGTNT